MPNRGCTPTELHLLYFGSLYFGLLRDGAAWDKHHAGRASTDVWHMDGDGDLVSMEADLDKGTLRFWVDGKPHGPGWSSGVTGRLRWAVCLYWKGAAVQIVPTPELQRALQ